MTDWTKELDQTPEASTLPAKQIRAKGKPGPKKSSVKRKVVGLNFSEAKNKQLTQLEMQLKLAGIELPRGRSEAAELAITLLHTLLDGKGNTELQSWARGFIADQQGLEDRQADENS